MVRGLHGGVRSTYGKVGIRKISKIGGEVYTLSRVNRDHVFALLYSRVSRLGLILIALFRFGR